MEQEILLQADGEVCGAGKLRKFLLISFAAVAIPAFAVFSILYAKGVTVEEFLGFCGKSVIGLTVTLLFIFTIWSHRFCKHLLSAPVKNYSRLMAVVDHVFMALSICCFLTFSICAAVGIQRGYSVQSYWPSVILVEGMLLLSVVSWGFHKVRRICISAVVVLLLCAPPIKSKMGFFLLLFLFIAFLLLSYRICRYVMSRKSGVCSERKLGIAYCVLTWVFLNFIYFLCGLPEDHIRIGMSDFREGRYEEALKVFEAENQDWRFDIFYNPYREGVVMYTLAQTYSRLGRQEDAERTYDVLEKCHVNRWAQNVELYKSLEKYQIAEGTDAKDDSCSDKIVPEENAATGKSIEEQLEELSACVARLDKSKADKELRDGLFSEAMAFTSGIARTLSKDEDARIKVRDEILSFCRKIDSESSARAAQSTFGQTIYTGILAGNLAEVDESLFLNLAEQILLTENCHYFIKTMMLHSVLQHRITIHAQAGPGYEKRDTEDLSDYDERVLELCKKYFLREGVKVTDYPQGLALLNFIQHLTGCMIVNGEVTDFARPALDRELGLEILRGIVADPDLKFYKKEGYWEYLVEFDKDSEKEYLEEMKRYVSNEKNSLRMRVQFAKKLEKRGIVESTFVRELEIQQQEAESEK